MARVRKFFQLPPGERLILVQAWGLFILVDLALRILSFQYLLNLSKKIVLRRKDDSALTLAPSIMRLSWLVEVAGRYNPVRATCLQKALVLSWFLGRRGIPTALRIGVARHEGRLKAHAWLDHDGQVILGHHEGEHYAPLLTDWILR